MDVGRMQERALVPPTTLAPLDFLGRRAKWDGVNMPVKCKLLASVAQASLSFFILEHRVAQEGQGTAWRNWVSNLALIFIRSLT